MYYCEACRIRNEWPASRTQVVVVCECCGCGNHCWDRPDDSLPQPPAPQSPPTDLEQFIALVEEIRTLDEGLAMVRQQRDELQKKLIDQMLLDGETTLRTDDCTVYMERKIVGRFLPAAGINTLLAKLNSEGLAHPVYIKTEPTKELLKVLADNPDTLERLTPVFEPYEMFRLKTRKREKNG